MKIIKKFFSSVFLAFIFHTTSVHGKTFPSTRSDSIEVITVEKENFDQKKDNKLLKKEFSLKKGILKKRKKRFVFLSKLKERQKQLSTFPENSKENLQKTQDIPSSFVLILCVLLLTNSSQILAENLNNMEIKNLKKFLKKKKRKILLLLGLFSTGAIIYMNKERIILILEQICHPVKYYMKKIIDSLLPKESILDEFNYELKIRILDALKWKTDQLFKELHDELNLKKRREMVEMLSTEFQRFETHLQNIKNNKNLLKKFKKNYSLFS